MSLINIEPETLAHRAEPVEAEPDHKPEPVEVKPEVEVQVAEIKIEAELLKPLDHIHVGELASIYQGDCIEVMATFPENSIDAIVTDPPYGLQFMGKEWDSPKMLGQMATGKEQRGAYAYGGSHSQGFFANDSYLFQEWVMGWAEQAFRVLKPGGHLLSFGGTRTYHRMASAVEDAGFEIRDMLQWLYGTGFPKSHNVQKAMDKKNVDSEQWEGWGTALKPAQEPIVLARKPLIGTVIENVLEHGTAALNIDASRVGGEPVPINKLEGWSGFGQEKQPNYTPTVNKDGRWPANVILTHHPECEHLGVKKVKPSNGSGKASAKSGGFGQGMFGGYGEADEVGGTHVEDDGTETVEAWDCHEDCPIRILDQQSGISKSSGGSGEASRGALGQTVYGEYEQYDKGQELANHGGLGDVGGASRFFYQAKASKKERESGLIGQLECVKCGELDSTHHTTEKGKKQKCHRNEHPTVKPVALMEYLVRLVTPPGGIVLDPFLGSGTTGVAAVKQGFYFVGIEKEEDYLPLAKARIADG